MNFPYLVDGSPRNARQLIDLAERSGWKPDDPSFLRTSEAADYLRSQGFAIEDNKQDPIELTPVTSRILGLFRV